MGKRKRKEKKEVVEEPQKAGKFQVEFDANDPAPFGDPAELKIAGFVDSLSDSEKFRLKALEHLEEKYKKLRQQYKDEQDKLLEKYQPLFEPLWKKRAEIISGAYEPTPDDLSVPEEVPKTASESKGISGFWLNVLKQHDLFASRINRVDEEMLRHLHDIKYSKLSGPSFSIDFHFSDNPFFNNTVLKKTYQLKENEMGIPLVEKVEGTIIKWKDDAEEKKKHPSKSSDFFQYFVDKSEDLEEEELEDLQEKDLEYGLAISETIIPWAITLAKQEPAFDLGVIDSDEENDDDDDDDDSEGETSQAPPPECKTQ